MQIKIVGIGKCGMRITYDLFAFTNDMPTSYQIRIEGPRAGLGIISDKVGDAIISLRRFVKAVVVDPAETKRAAQEPKYVTIDSDNENNEISRTVKFETKEYGEHKTGQIFFPGTNFSLNDFQGGCDFHIVSEYLAKTWQNVPPNITDIDGADIFATTFSIGGGTGAGSAPIISQLATKKSNIDKKRKCHFMGLGVLPKSDEEYTVDDLALTVADHDKFNTGRFAAALYGGRFSSAFNSVWVFSNDMMRFLNKFEEENNISNNGVEEAKTNHSSVNAYIASSLVLLANSSSHRVKSHTNPDPTELNNKLNGKLIVSAYGIDANSKNDTDHVLGAKRILSSAIRNVSQTTEGICGLGVPVHEDDLSEINKILDTKDTSRTHFLQCLEGYNPDEGPIEFSTAESVVVFYGQPNDWYSTEREQYIESFTQSIFGNSRQVYYNFSHPSERDVLLILIVDPYCLPVVSSLFYYANLGWSGHNDTAPYDDYIHEQLGEDDVSRVLKGNEKGEERLPELYGDSAATIASHLGKDPELAIQKENVIEAFKHLRVVRNRKRMSTRTSSSARSRRANRSVSSTKKKKSE